MDRPFETSQACEIRQFSASDGYRFHYRHWKPMGHPPRGYVIALHGIQSHSGWYEYSSARLADSGYDVRFLDRRGSGMNGRDRGHAPHASRLINDVVQFLNDVRQQRDDSSSEAPVILLAVSWGAKLAAAVAAARREHIDALALLYPGICSRVRPRWHQRLRLRLAHALGIDKKRIPIPLGDPALFTDAPQWQAFIREDPLAIHDTTVGFLNASLDLDRAAGRAPPAIQVPVLVMLAGRDRIIDNAATLRYFERFASQKGRLLAYAQAAHTLEFEAERDRIFDDLLAWLTGLAPMHSPARVDASTTTVSPPHIDLSGVRSPSSPAGNVL